jgi:hypothetical protein
MTRVTDAGARGQFWSGWLCRKLPTELAPHVVGVVERGERLVIYASSPAWSARLRYAISELEPQLRAAAPALISIAVRVQPGV